MCLSTVCKNVKKNFCLNNILEIEYRKNFKKNEFVSKEFALMKLSLFGIDSWLAILD